MSVLKKTVSVEAELYQEASAISKNFSAVVNDALESYIRQQKVEKAIKSFGKWESRRKSSVAIVNSLREEGRRKYAKRSD